MTYLATGVEPDNSARHGFHLIDQALNQLGEQLVVPVAHGHVLTGRSSLQLTGIPGG